MAVSHRVLEAAFVATTPISFTGTLTLQDTLDLQRYRAFCRIRRSIRWLIAVVSASLAATIIFLFVHRIFNVQLPVILMLCAYIPFGSWFAERWRIRLYSQRHPEYYIENTVAVDESSISVHNFNMDLRLSWNQLSLIFNTPKGLMFMMPQTRMPCWLPQRLFEGNEHKQIIITYATENKVPVRSTK